MVSGFDDPAIASEDEKARSHLRQAVFGADMRAAKKQGQRG